MQKTEIRTTERRGAASRIKARKMASKKAANRAETKRLGPRTTGGEGRQQGKGDTNKPSGRGESKRDTPPQQGTDQGQKNQSSDSQGDKEKPDSVRSRKSRRCRAGTAASRKPAPQFQPPPIDFSSAFSWLLPFLQYGFYLVLAGLAAVLGLASPRGDSDGDSRFACRNRLVVGTTLGRPKKDRQGGGRSGSRACHRTGHLPTSPTRFPRAWLHAASSDPLVRYLFEAWKHGPPRRAARAEPNKRPTNSPAMLPVTQAALRHLSTNLADLYCEAAYAPGRLRITDEKPLQELWRALHARPVSRRAKRRFTLPRKSFILIYSPWCNSSR